MKNIERYQNTSNALAAYSRLCGKKKKPFDEWLECEYAEPNEQTLLEAAKAVAMPWYEKGPKGSLEEVAKRVFALSSAAEREQRKPVRMLDRFSTERDAREAFIEFCANRMCINCRFGDRSAPSGCAIAWLYSKDENEEAK